MTRLINRVLNADDLPLAELSAARLDGEVYAVDECYAAIDEVNTTVVRALAIASIAPKGVIAELSTAAWILGAASDPPIRHQFSIDVTQRVRTPQSNRFVVRECVVKPGDVAPVAGFAVTSALRTAIDVLRTTPQFGAHEGGMVAELLRIGGLTESDCESRLNSQPSAPGSRRAHARLRRLLLAGRPDGGNAVRHDRYPALTR